MAMLVLLVLAVIPFLPMLGAIPGLSGNRVAVAKVEPPVFSTAPAMIDGEETTYAPPEDPSLSLTVPSLGVYGHTVQDDASAEALDEGAVKIPSTGFPWERSANTYIAGHRVGYRDTESYYQFLELPSMKKGDEVILEDGDGGQYVYAVTEIFAVEPHETWVTEPVAGKDMVTLQTCTESVEDWETIGPEVMVSGPDTGRLVVQAERV
ncbi:MAG: class E sortase [Actinomycetota bacterium]|jgi:sortase A|nr:class E sortase [Rubrobacter sp.]MDQ3506670.1 class E sortase [Actinomycetota bacterium]